MTMKLIKLITTCSALAMLTVTPMLVQAGAVVVNPANSNSLANADIQRIFLGKSKTFADGSKATVLDQAEGSSEREAFANVVLNKNGQQLKAYWAQQLFTGKGKPPEELADSAAVKAKVASDPSAIGYIADTDVDASVKVVLSY